LILTDYLFMLHVFFLKVYEYVYTRGLVPIAQTLLCLGLGDVVQYLRILLLLLF
jgi:hypothetical protein